MHDFCGKINCCFSGRNGKAAGLPVRGNKFFISFLRKDVDKENIECYLSHKDISAPIK